jgi:large subunit ribosomal protein L23
MDPINVIIRPLVTEKSTHQQTTRNAYTFEVNRDANKVQIAQAVRSLYNVKVQEVRTMNRKGKPRRAKYRMTKTSDWKRAVVVLAEDSRIEIF